MSSSSIPPLLPSVCLCAIVKNERMNPAGGISAYLDRILPFVHTAVIVDTGSDDGTLEALRARESAEQCNRAHLHVFETPFVSFADARNDALRKALDVREEQTREGRTTFRHILVLDADEVLTLPCIELLASVLALDRSDPSTGSDFVPLLEKSSSVEKSNFSRQSSTLHSASPSSNALSPPRCRSRAPSCAAVDSAALSAEAAAATAAGAALLADSFAGFTLPAAPATPLPLLRYPLALKCSCHCYAASGVASPRSNSGLWNPRIFSADPRFSFVNLVDNYRFERLLFAGREIPAENFLRENDLPEGIKSGYEALRAQELRAASGETSSSSTAATAAAAAFGTTGTGGYSPSSSFRSSTKGDFSFGVDGEFDDPATASGPAPASGPASGSAPPLSSGTSTSTASVSPSPHDASAEDDSCSSFRSQALLVPMRHFIPSLAGRRKKNQAYKDGAARAKAAAATAAAASGGLAAAAGSVDSPCSVSSSSLSPNVSYSPLLPGSRSPQPKSPPSSRSRIFQPSHSMDNGGQ